MKISSDFQTAALNTLDFDAERLRLQETQRAVLNILEDADTEKSNLERTQRATFNILEDFNIERLRLLDTQRALLNILDDLNQSSEELQKAHDALEVRVLERTAELQQSNIRLQAEMDERRKAEEVLRRRTDELARSNTDLEQFAYVASHDLQEPLRMVSSYTQLLAQHYEGRLDEKAKKFIDYAVDGATRMQRLINDLLVYSRVGTRGKPLEATDTHSLLGETIRNLAAMIEENRAIITNDELPTVRADASQLRQVFQNLISNAIKFRGEELPHIHLSAQDQGREWVFCIKDNGIGIDRQYADRIFVIFQRLHTRQEYPGTGIGLALCKRIVERHGGRIWFESEPGKGSMFFFTIPK